MANRVIASDVSAILDNTSLTDPQIEIYITTAETLVTEVLGSSDLGADMLKEIERYLTAHLIVMTRERLSKKEEAGSAKIEYAGVFGSGLDATSHGQMVKVLDTTGGFAALGGKEVSIYAIKSFD